MAHRFEIAKDLVVDASPEQVWEAIATGPGMDSWFMGRSEIEPREGGTARWSIGGYTEDATVTAWDPPRRLVSTGSPSPDGSFHQFEYRIEGRDGGGTGIRYEHSGMLGGDWEAEYDAMNEGDPMYLHKLVQYLTYFRGRFAAPVDAQGPQVPDRVRAMTVFERGLGLDGEVAEGDHVRLIPEGLGAIEGVVDYVSPHFLGVRTSDALYRFIHGFDGTVMVGHHLFADGVDREEAERAWRAWLDRLFDPSGGGAGSPG
ncbi:MAG TPA: SRPBCC domain-containing protein [Actinomycetota bacterium]|nr:SRPBCC domain-containing protein [Actinomycetota bacterium]